MSEGFVIYVPRALPLVAPRGDGAAPVDAPHGLVRGGARGLHQLGAGQGGHLGGEEEGQGEAQQQQVDTDHGAASEVEHSIIWVYLRISALLQECG